MKRLSLVLALMLVFAVSSMVSAELLDPEVLPYTGRYGGTMTVSGGSEGPKSFNPHLAAETSTTDITDQMFEGLVRLDRDTGEIIPHLARDFEFSEDQTEITFYLRRGVQWQDGEEFTADDVIFSLDVIYHPDIPSNSKTGLHIDGEPLQYEKIDKYTVKITLPRVHSPILYNIPFEIIPEHLLREAFDNGTFTETWTLASDPKAVVATGPWMISSYRVDQELVLVRNPNYWQFDEDGNQLPYLNRIVFRYYPNQDTAVLAFFAGEFDYHVIPATHYTEFEDREASSPWKIYSAGPNAGTSFIVFNQNPGFMEEPKLSWFSDKAFRQALAHAVDKETILQMEMNGRGFIQNSPINMRNEFFLKEDVKTYEYDLQKAHELLEAAGYPLGADGVRRDSEGNVLEFDMFTNQGVAIRQTIGELFQEDLGELGIEVNFHLINFNVLVDKLLSTFDWDAIIVGLTGTFDPNGGSNTWFSHGNLHMWNPMQETPYTEWEARIDELFTAAQRTMDWDERREHYFEFQDIVAEQVPLIYTVNAENNLAIRDHLMHPGPSGVAGGLADAWHFLWIDR